MSRNTTVENNVDDPERNSIEDDDDDSNHDEKLLMENTKESSHPSDPYNISNKSGDMQPIAKEFREHYERKLQEICEDNNIGCIQAKMKLQEDWIRDLTEQNEMLIKAVIELESEATERVKKLEGKLKDSVTSGSEESENSEGKNRNKEPTNVARAGEFDQSDQFRSMQENYSALKQATCTTECPARLRVVALERENKELKAAIKQAQLELQQLENKTENYLDGDGGNYGCRPLKDIQMDVIPTVALCEAHLDYQFNDPNELYNIFIGGKPRDGSKSTSKKSSTFELEDVINNLSESVSQMMMRNATNKSCNRRIQDLEHQLAETMKTKDLDIDEERNRRNVEINNLIRTIQEQEETLQSLQYQSKNLTECMNVSALKSTIKQLKEDHNQMYQVIESQKNELNICSQELIRLQDILQTDAPVEGQDMASIEQRLQDALKTNEVLMAQIAMLKSKLSSDSKAGSIYQDRISELQSVIGDKNVEINRWHTTALDFKRQLDQSSQKQEGLEHNINSMQRNMVKSDIVSVIQNEETDACREEVDVCLGELRELKGKINLEASIYSQKIEELQTLKNRCTLQNGTIEVLRRDLKDERIRHKDEVLNLKQQIRELKERDTMLNIDNRKHLECIKHLEDKLKDLTDRERHLINESSNRESELSERVTKSKSEEIRLVNEVTQLEQRAAVLDAEVQRLRSELQAVTIICRDRQAEMASLKTEVNLLLQRQGKIKAENTKLRSHINNLQRTKRSTNGDSEKLMGQLDNVLRQLEHMHGEKEYLVIQNEQLQQCMCTREAELAQAQQQLEEIRSNRDEVCEESRTVVSNVRQWLHHQHSISEQVKEKVKKLERENRDLQISMQEMTAGAVFAVPCRMRGGSPVRSRSSSLIYPCNCNLNSRGGTQSPASVTSVSSADDSSVNYSSGSENEMEIKLSKQLSTPEVWLHKVENMTAELQRSNSYWKRKLYKTKTMHEEKQ